LVLGVELVQYLKQSMSDAGLGIENQSAMSPNVEMRPLRNGSKAATAGAAIVV
jgi:hypothetical protein